MATQLTLEDILSDVPDFVKLIEDGASIEADIKANGWITMASDIPKYQADLLRVANDIGALWASKQGSTGV